MRDNIRQITIFISFRKNNSKICIAVINEQIPLAIKEKLANTLLTANDIPTDWDINRLLSFILTIQGSIQNCAQSHFSPPHEFQRPCTTGGHPEFLTAGTDDLDAHFAASRLLGHERAYVTNIYLLSVRGGKHIEV